MFKISLGCSIKSWLFKKSHHISTDLFTGEWKWRHDCFKVIGKGKVYCRHEGEKRQCHLEGARLNQANRMNQAVVVERIKWGREEKGSKEATWEPKGQERKQEPQEPVVKCLSLYRKEKLREGSQSLGWEVDRLRNAQRTTETMWVSS